MVYRMGIEPMLTRIKSPPLNLSAIGAYSLESVHHAQCIVLACIALASSVLVYPVSSYSQQYC